MKHHHPQTRHVFYNTEAIRLAIPFAGWLHPDNPIHHELDCHEHCNLGTHPLLKPAIVPNIQTFQQKAKRDLLVQGFHEKTTFGHRVHCFCLGNSLFLSFDKDCRKCQHSSQFFYCGECLPLLSKLFVVRSDYHFYNRLRGLLHEECDREGDHVRHRDFRDGGDISDLQRLYWSDKVWEIGKKSLWHDQVAVSKAVKNRIGRWVDMFGDLD